MNELVNYSMQSSLIFNVLILIEFIQFMYYSIHYDLKFAFDY